MDQLTKYIREQLEHKDRCTVFRPEITRVWPKLSEMVAERNAAIQAFAEERGWTAEIIDPGVVVTFRRKVARDLNQAGVGLGLRAANPVGGAGGDSYRSGGPER